MKRERELGECLRCRWAQFLSSNLPTCAYCGPEGRGWGSGLGTVWSPGKKFC